MMNLANIYNRKYIIYTKSKATKPRVTTDELKKLHGKDDIKKGN